MSARVELIADAGYVLPDPEIVAVGPQGESHAPNVTRVDDQTIVLLFFNFGNEQLVPGHLATIRFDLTDGGDQSIRFRAEGTFMSTARARPPEDGITLRNLE